MTLPVVVIDQLGRVSKSSEKFIQGLEEMKKQR